MRQLRWTAAAVMTAAALVTTAGAAPTAGPAGPAGPAGAVGAAGTRLAASSVPARNAVLLRHPAPPLTAAAGRSQPSAVPGALRSYSNTIYAGHLVPNSLYGNKKITAVVSQWIPAQGPRRPALPLHRPLVRGS